MKHIIALIVVIGTLMFCARTQSAQQAYQPKYEYASVRFMGKNTSFVWPDAKVEKLYTLMPDLKRPSDADDRIFHLTVAINLAAKPGFEVAAMPGSGGPLSISTDDIFFRRELK
jgi:hypothetical protein